MSEPEMDGMANKTKFASRSSHRGTSDMFRTKLPLLDILHRGVVYSLAGLTVWGIVMSVAVHRDTIQRGKGTL